MDQANKLIRLYFEEGRSLSSIHKSLREEHGIIIARNSLKQTLQVLSAKTKEKSSVRLRRRRQLEASGDSQSSTAPNHDDSQRPTKSRRTDPKVAKALSPRLEEESTSDVDVVTIEPESVPNEQDSQVKAFRTEAELESYAASLKLTRLPIKDLDTQSSLNQVYVGGWVVGSFASSNSQDNMLSIFIRDKSSSDRLQEAKQLMICIDGGIAEELPSMLSSEYKLFIYQGKLSANIPEYSQDLSNCIVVRGKEPRVWIVHKNAKKPGFLQQKSCKPSWHQKQKKRHQARVSPSPERNTAETSPAPSSPSSHTYSLPDDFDFPDSAFNATYAPGDETSTASSESDEDDSEYLPKRTAPTSAYQYKPLVELNPGEKKVNVFGVVKEFTEPKATRGADLYMSMVIVDETRPLDGVKCLVFKPTEHGLPHIRRVGDIVSLHRVIIEDYQGRLQIISNKFSSCQRFSGRIGRSFKVHTASQSFTFTASDKRRVKELRLWHQKMSKSLCEKLDAVQPYHSFGLLCQVLSVTQPKSKDCVLLTVWDGTKCQLSLHQREVSEDDRVVSNHSHSLSALAVGLECQVVILCKTMFGTACTLRPGAVVVINNVIAVERDDESFELCAKTGSSLEVLKKSDGDYDDLMTGLQMALDIQPTVTSTSNRYAPFIALADLQTHSSESVRARVRVKMLRVATSTLEDMSRLTCDKCALYLRVGADMPVSEEGVSSNPCSVCAQTGQGLSANPHCTYSFHIEVTDLSGIVLNVHVTGKEGVRLLNDLPPTNFHQHQQARYRLLQKLYELAGGNPPFSPTTAQPRPWIDCCLLKFKHEDKDMYLLFDTTLTV